MSSRNDIQVLLETLPTVKRTDLIWPDLAKAKVILKPPRVGVDRHTGKILYGWEHVVQSVGTILSTPFHSRVLRRWVGSFVPHVLGSNAVERTITRFYWAVTTSLDLWEPNYRLQRVFIQRRADGSSLTSPEELRSGNLSLIQEGVYRPRAHLGDLQPQTRRQLGLVTRGLGLWEPAP